MASFPSKGTKMLWFSPKLWMQNYAYDEETDDFIRDIINNRRMLKIFFKDRYSLYFLYKSKFYSVWVAQMFAYLSRVDVASLNSFFKYKRPEYDKVTAHYCYKNFYDYMRPSRKTIADFYNTIDVPATALLQKHNLLNLRNNDKPKKDMFVMLDGKTGQIIYSDRSIEFKINF